MSDDQAVADWLRWGGGQAHLCEEVDKGWAVDDKGVACQWLCCFFPVRNDDDASSAGYYGEQTDDLMEGVLPL